MRILLVEDERKVATFIARSLRENAYAVDVAFNGEDGFQLACENPYDVILLDVRLPGITGIELCRNLRREEIQSPILMLTARGLVEQRVEGLDAGADDYLIKPFALAELQARVRALIRRGFRRGEAKLRCADLELDRHRRLVSRGTGKVSLTSKEFALLELLLLRAPDTVTRGEIIEHVWDSHFDSETNLVDVYINRLRQKIDQGHAVKLVHTLRGVGYRLSSET
jgi:two-component system, OmpR family, copper resistance phosphate regulon response regulator CusR